MSDRATGGAVVAGDGAVRAVPLVVLAAGRAARYGGVKPLAPVGVGGEAVLDILASDACSAGFRTIVLVVGGDTGAAIRYHVARTWPGELDVRFADQPMPRGTVDAVRAAAAVLDPASHFAVANADDLPGIGALARLAAHLGAESPSDAVVTFALGDSVIGDAPVTRGACLVAEDGTLLGIDERRQVTRREDGRFVAHDGREPAELDPDQPVSVNLWGFSPAMREVFEEAMARPVEGEVLLPDVVQSLLGAADGPARAAAAATAAPAPALMPAMRIEALRAPGRCIGVTHASDVPLVTAALAREIGRGERPAALWSALAGTGGGAGGTRGPCPPLPPPLPPPLGDDPRAPGNGNGTLPVGWCHDPRGVRNVQYVRTGT